MNKIVSILILVISDIFTIFFSIILAVTFRQILNIFIETAPSIDYSYIGFISIYVTLILVLAYFGLYSRRFDFWHESRLILKSCFFSFILLLAGLMLGQNIQYYSRSTLILIFSLSAICLPISKIFIKKFLYNIGIWKKSAKVISDNELFKSELFENYYLGYVKSSDTHHRVLFIDSTNLSRDTLNRIIENNIKHSREIIFIPILRDYDFSNSNIYNLFNSRVNIFTLNNELLSKINIFIKGSIDYIIVLLSSIFWIPIFLVIALLIKKEDPKGKVLFTQKRLGKNGKEFNCYKFRSMCSDQSFMQKWLQDNPEEKRYYEKYHKYINDPRITKIGKFLRRTSLDEIPQLINVLKGDMSLVGPRPYMINEKNDIGQKASLILEVKPGITGLWQVSGRSDVCFEERVGIDIWYIKNWSLWNDLVILIKTLEIVFQKKGAY